MRKLLIINEEKCRNQLKELIKDCADYVEMNVDVQPAHIPQIMQVIKSACESRIAVYSSDSVIIIKIQDIIRCESHRNYTELHLVENRHIMASKTLKEFEIQLRPHGFLRVHKSHLVNLSHIERIVKSEGGFIQMSDKSKLPVSMGKKLLLAEILRHV